MTGMPFGTAPATGTPPVVPGYQLIRRIGRGGAGEVFEAVRVGPGGFRKSVALKRLIADQSLSGKARQRFLEEARLTAQLEHANLVRVHDVVTSGADLFIVMELLRGGSFAHVVEQRREHGEVPWWLPVAVAAPALDGLAHAHAAGLVHRDLTPRNLFVCVDGTVRVLDFGIAKQRDGASLTSRGSIHGTVDFLSPEQARGEKVDRRSDLYQIAASIYWAVSGRSPHGDGTAGEVLARAAVGTHAPLDGVPPALAALIERGLAADPAARFPDATAMAAELRALLDPGAHDARAIAEIVRELPAASDDEAPSHTISATGPIAETQAPVPAPTAAPRRRVRWWWFAAPLAIVAAFVLGLAMRRAAPTPRPIVSAPPTFELMTFRRGFITNARFVPGTDQFVYSAAWDGGKLHLYQGAPGNVLGRELGDPGTDLAAVAPDGTLLLLVDRPLGSLRGTLATMSLAGGAPRKLLEGVFGADQAADGTMAVVREAEDRVVVEFPLGTRIGEMQLQWTPAIRISPSGERIVYIDHPSGMDGGAVMVAERGGAPRRIGEVWRSAHAALWVDDDTLWVSGTRTGGVDYVFEVELDGRERAVTQTTTDVAMMDRNADGDGLMVSTTWAMRSYGDLTGQGPPAYLSVWAGGAPTLLSPDGTWVVAVDTAMRAGDFTVYTAPVDGHAPPTKLATGLALEISPDGTQVLVVSPLGDRLRAVPVGAGSEVEVPFGDRFAEVQYAEWRTAGRVLLSGRDAAGVWLLATADLATGTVTPVGRAGLRMRRLGGGLVSPDGTHACVTDDASGANLVVSLVDGAERPLDDPCEGWIGNAALALARQGEPGVLDRLDLATGARTPWKSVPPPDRAGLRGYGPVWFSDDGSRYIFHETIHLHTLAIARDVR